MRGSVSSSEFRQIAVKQEAGHKAGRAERLFRASVSAFCSLTRPSREAIVQLDDLTEPLYGDVTPETLRYAAAALSECRRAPPGLMRRLAFEPIHIAAPVLMRSGALSDADLVAVIARHGLIHARAIRMRAALDTSVEKLIVALEAAAGRGASPPSPAAQPSPPATPPEKPVMRSTFPASHHRPGSAAEAAREKLRAIMASNSPGEQAPVEAPEFHDGAAHFARLRDTALTGSIPVFRTALTDALDIGFAESMELVRPGREKNLALALRGIGMSAENAFLILSIVFPGVFSQPASIRRFLDDYAMTHVEAGRDEIRRLRLESLAAIVAQRRRGLQPQPAQPAPEPLLKAS